MKQSEAFPFPSRQSDRIIGTPDRYWLHPLRNVWVVRDAAAGRECWYDLVDQRPVSVVWADAATGEFARPLPFEDG